VLSAPFTGYGVTVYPEGEHIRVVYEYLATMGMPRRDTIGYALDEIGRPQPLKVDAFTLRLGEWGRLRYNGRHSGDCAWWYEKWVVNVGFFGQERPMWPTAFLDSPPSARYSQMADLW